MHEDEPSPANAEAGEAEASGHLEVPAGSLIYREGEPGSGLFVIEQGQVDLTAANRGGAESPLRRGPGETFGEEGLWEGSRRTESAQARTACRLIPIPGDLFPEVVRAEPRVALGIILQLVERMREAATVAQAGAASPEEPDSPVEIAGLPLVPEPPATTRQATTALVHEESGQRFVLSTEEETTIGRSGSGVEPDIDLSALDPHSTVSRAHAVIVRRDEGYFVVERKPSTNGTFVNRDRIAAGVEIPLPVGCELAIGSVRMKLDTG
jgi:hypothetical protein